MGAKTLVLKSVGVALLSVVVGLVVAFISSEPLYNTVDWRIKVLDYGATGLFRVCGMHAGPRAGKTIFGTNWRPCFELLRPSQSAGDWGGVSSTDVNVPYGSGTMKARVFTPIAAAAVSALLPTMVYYHGGGWTISHYNDMEYDSLCRQMALRGGWLVVHPEYPLAPENPFPHGLRASYNALAWVAHSGHPSLSHSDPSRLLIGGDSAGGNLAAVLSLLCRDGVDVDGLPSAPRIALRHQLLVYPGLFPSLPTASEQTHVKAPILASGIRAFFTSQYLGSDTSSLKTDWRVSPLLAKSFSMLPPATLVHAEFDLLRDEGAMYATKLREASVPVVELDFGNVPHGFYAFLSLGMETTMRSVNESVDEVNKALATTAENKL